MIIKSKLSAGDIIIGGPFYWRALSLSLESNANNQLKHWPSGWRAI